MVNAQELDQKDFDKCGQNFSTEKNQHLCFSSLVRVINVSMKVGTNYFIIVTDHCTFDTSYNIQIRWFKLWNYEHGVRERMVLRTLEMLTVDIHSHHPRARQGRFG